MEESQKSFLQEVFDEYLPEDHTPIKFKLFYNTRYPHFDYKIILRAIECDNITLCRVLHLWYPNPLYTTCRALYTLDRIIDTAIYYDNLRLCRFFVRRDSNDPDRMLQTAARMGNVRLCRAAKRWSATDFDEMLISAASSGQIAICKLAIKWGATKYQEALSVAARHGFEDMCRYLFEKCVYTYDVESILVAAAVGGHAHICALAKQRGARNFLQMKEYAQWHHYHHSSVIALADLWISQQ